MGGSTDGMQGHPAFDDIWVIDVAKKNKDLPNGAEPAPDKDGWHVVAHLAFTGRKPVGPAQEDALILSPRFFRERDIPTTDSLDCKFFGDHLTDGMLMSASWLVHEYAHFDQITHRALGGQAIDQPGGYGVEGASKLDKAKALMNAGSYSWLATELAWSVRCKREFVYPDLDERALYPPHDHNLHIPNPDHEDNLSTPLEIARRTSVTVSPKQ
jgi:hypothetical protein